MIFDRYAALDFGTEGRNGTRIEGLRLRFDVKYTRDAKPNPGKVDVYNLARSSLDALNTPRSAVRVFAGYQGAPVLVGFGSVVRRSVVTRREASGDVVTSIEFGDSLAALTRSRVVRAWSGDTPWLDVWGAVVAAAGLPVLGDLPTAARAYRWSHGVALTHAVGDALAWLAELVGARAVVRDGVIVVLPVGGDSGEPAPLLDSAAGNLITAAPVKDGSRFVALLDEVAAAIRPGSPFEVRHPDARGVFVARSVRFVGDTHGVEWYAEVEGVPRGG